MIVYWVGSFFFFGGWGVEWYLTLLTLILREDTIYFLRKYDTQYNSIEKIVYNGPIEVANRLMMTGETKSDTREATVILIAQKLL